MASLYVPVATNCAELPLATDGVAGVTAMLAKTAAVAVSVVLPLMAPDVAETSVVPAASVEANPLVPAVLETVAVATVADAHVTDPDRSCVVASSYVPVATN